MKTKGFSLVELIVVLAIIAILMGLAAPSFDTWITNSKIRATAESLQNGLRKAQQMAATRNGSVQFYLTNQIAGQGVFCEKLTGKITAGDVEMLSKDGSFWTICSLEDHERKTLVSNQTIDDVLPVSQTLADGNGLIAITVEEGDLLKQQGKNNYIEFRGLGGANINSQQVFYVTSSASKTNSAPRFKCANEHSAQGGEVQCLKVILSPGGRVRVCNPIYDKNNVASGKINPMACNY